MDINKINFLPIGLMVRKVGGSLDDHKDAFATAKYREAFRKQVRSLYKLTKTQVCDEGLQLHHIVQRDFEVCPVGCTGKVRSRWFKGTSAFGNLTLISESEHQAVHAWNDKYLPSEMKPGDDPVYLRALVPVRWGAWNLPSIQSGDCPEVRMSDLQAKVEEIDKEFDRFAMKGRRLRSCTIEGVNTADRLAPLLVDIAKYNGRQTKISPDVAYDFISNFKVLEPYLPESRKTYDLESCIV